MFRWYVINTYSGQEGKVRTDMWRRADSLEAREFLRDIVVPTEKVFEGSGADRKQVEQRTMPGYVLINLDLNEKSWEVVRHTPGVTGFVGAGGQPDPLSKNEVDRILGRKETQSVAVKTSVYHSGDRVEILDGPLKGFTGTISDVNEGDAKAKVLVAIFGRETPAELAFTDLQPVKA